MTKPFVRLFSSPPPCFNVIEFKNTKLNTCKFYHLSQGSSQHIVFHVSLPIRRHHIIHSLNNSLTVASSDINIE